MLELLTLACPLSFQPVRGHILQPLADRLVQIVLGVFELGHLGVLSGDWFLALVKVVQDSQVAWDDLFVEKGVRRLEKTARGLQVSETIVPNPNCHSHLGCNCFLRHAPSNQQAKA